MSEGTEQTRPRLAWTASGACKRKQNKTAGNPSGNRRGRVWDTGGCVSSLGVRSGSESSSSVQGEQPDLPYAPLCTMGIK